MTDRAISVQADGVWKKFKLVHERNNSIKAALVRGRRTVSEDFWALRDVSLEVYQGETFGLIGENGSGKSTMLKCLTKILRPDRGTVGVHGKVSALLELGAGFHPELSGRENVFLNGAILGLSQKELRKRFDEIVDFSGIHQFIDEPVKNYSSGMYVRLGFSVAINVDPDVLFVDEVLAVGDEAFQRKCNEKFAQLKQAGKTIVLVSHGLYAVQNLCDRVAWFSHGQVMQVGNPRDVIESYTGTIHSDRQLDETGHTRWGSGEGRITGVAFVAENGDQTTTIRSGEPATLRLEYQMDSPIDTPVFGFSISTVEGFQVTAPSNRDAGCVPEKLQGSGHVDINFDPVVLLPGSYDLTVSLHDYHCMHPYDVRQNVLRFDVDRGPLVENAGVVSLSPKWRIGDLVAE